MRFQKISVFLQIFRCASSPLSRAKAGGTDQSSDVRRQRGGGIAADFLPALLRSQPGHGGPGKQPPAIPWGTGQNLGGRSPLEPPGEQNGESDFVELDSPPVGSPSIQKFWAKPPFSCWETANKSALAKVSHDLRQPACRSAIDHVARPYQVVPALVLVALCFSPGNGERGDEALPDTTCLRERESKLRLLRYKFPPSPEAFSSGRILRSTRPIAPYSACDALRKEC